MHKKILVLGAGPYQAPAIKKAVELGLYVITVDNLPDSVGHQFSHRSVNCSTVDRNGIKKIACSLDVDGVLTFASGVATATVAFVTEALGLPGMSLLAAETMSSKGKFRTLQRERGLNAPAFAVIDSVEALSLEVPKLTPPLMFKPVDTSGSRGTTRVEANDLPSWVSAFERAKQFSRSGQVCVEEYLDGFEVGGDAFLTGGELVFIGITHKYTRNFVVTGHSLPTNASALDQQRIRNELQRCCAELGYTEGPLNFDAMVTPERVTVIEMSPRTGGNGIPALIERATSFDLITTTLRFALGEPIERPINVSSVRPCGSLVFGATRAGRLQSIATAEQVFADVPEIFDYYCNYQAGERVPKFVHGGAAIGYCLFEISLGSTYQDMIRRINHTLAIRLQDRELPA